MTTTATLAGTVLSDASSISVEDSKSDSSQLEVVVHSKNLVALNDAALITRQGSAYFSGFINRVKQSHGQNGFEAAFTGRDNLEKLSQRTVGNELFLGCEPSDIVQYLNMPSLLVRSSDDVVLQRPVFESQSDGKKFTYDNDHFLYQWGNPGNPDYTKKEYQWAIGGGSCSLNYNLASYPPYPGDAFLNVSTDEFESDIYAASCHIYAAIDNIYMGLADHNFGFFPKYVDENNYVLATVHTVIAGGGPYHIIVHVAINKCVSGVGTSLYDVIIGDVTGIPSGLSEEDITIKTFISGTSLRFEFVVFSGKLISGVSTTRGEVSINSFFVDKTFHPGIYCGTPSMEYGEGSLNAKWNHVQYTNVFNALSSEGWVGDLIFISDLDESTSWTSTNNQSAGMWVSIDLGEAKSISGIKIIQNQVNYARNYKIQYSTDNTNWNDVITRTSAYWQTILEAFTPISARYWRLYITDSAPYQLTIKEFYLREADPGTLILEEGTIDSYGAPVTYRVDGGSRKESEMRLAQLLGWSLWAGLDGKLNFQASRGSDLSGTVRFASGEDIISLDRETDILAPNTGETIHPTGFGLGQQNRPVSPTVSNPTLISEHPELAGIEKPAGGSAETVNRQSGIDPATVSNTTENNPDGTTAATEDFHDEGV